MSSEVTWYEGSRFWYFGNLCVSFYTLAGAWFSLGVHISLRPSYVDVHFLWFIFSVMGRERGIELQEAEWSNAEI